MNKVVAVLEINNAFDRFLEKKKTTIKGSQCTYSLELSYPAIEFLLENNIRLGDSLMKLIDDDLDKTYDENTGKDIPEFSHNEQKNREELNRIVDDLKKKYNHFQYVNKKDMKKHVVDHLAKKKRKLKSKKRKLGDTTKESKKTTPCKREFKQEQEMQPKSCQEMTRPKPIPQMALAPSFDNPNFSEERTSHSENYAITINNFCTGSQISIPPAYASGDLVMNQPQKPANISKVDYSFSGISAELMDVEPNQQDFAGAAPIQPDPVQQQQSAVASTQQGYYQNTPPEMEADLSSFDIYNSMFHSTPSCSTASDMFGASSFVMPKSHTGINKFFDTYAPSTTSANKVSATPDIFNNCENNKVGFDSYQSIHGGSNIFSSMGGIFQNTEAFS